MRYRLIGTIGGRRVYMVIRHSWVMGSLSKSVLVILVDGRDYAKQSFFLDETFITIKSIRDRSMDVARIMNEQFDSIKEVEYNIDFIELEE